MVTDSQTRRSKQIQRQTGRTFYLATRFLPSRVREATYVLYGFFRLADEVVDDSEPAPPAKQRATLERLREQALGNIPAEEPILEAFTEIRAEAGIPDQEIRTFIDAMLADVTDTEYETYDQLDEYLRGSAVAVAFMMVAVIDPPDHSAAKPPAKALGQAFQLTNFLRDVREDICEYDRIYLPTEALRRNDVTRGEIRELRETAGFRETIKAELERTEEKYRKGVAGIKLLPNDCQFPVLLAAILYAEHHRKIRAIDYRVLTSRPTLTGWDYSRIVARTLWHWWRIKDPEEVFYRVSAVPRTPNLNEYQGKWFRPRTQVVAMLERLRVLIPDRNQE